VTAAGGEGIAVRVDHAREEEVEALTARIERDRGRLDVLVNSLAGEDPVTGSWGPFWDADLGQGEAALRNMVLSHVITAKHAARLMIARRRGLIVEVVEGDTITGGGGGHVLRDLTKTTLKGLAIRMAEELRSRKVAAIAITPGFLRSEMMLQHFGVTEENWRTAARKDPNFLESETPRFIGRAVAALAADPKVMARTGDVTSSWELARAYGYTDADGSRPDWGRHLSASVVPSMPWLRAGFERHLALLQRATRRLEEALGGTATERHTVRA
jgi:NAD(P)-dependent dehydrogenase (short-subunit alcohol dehydrogenase family)